MTTENAIRDHQTWLGYLQPDGLVVSPAALVDAQVYLDRDAVDRQRVFQEFVQEVDVGDRDVATIQDLRRFLVEFLRWPSELVFGLSAERPVPANLTVGLPELNETLTPTLVLADVGRDEAAPSWLLLVKEVSIGTDLDTSEQGRDTTWSASATQKLERLLRETGVPIGLLTNGTHIRLLYAPRGENSGNVTFPIQAMTEVAGRPILSAFWGLLSRERLLAGPAEARLAALLVKSREYQATVSKELAGQVLDALYELVRGLQAADAHTRGQLLREVLADHPDEVYRALLTVLLRLVFLLYAEDRALLPTGKLYAANYSIHGLFARLRADAQKYPDTMDHRYGAWAQLVALFRAVYGGSGHPQLSMPPRKGFLFDPSRFPFLEGRCGVEDRQRLPLIADGVIYRILEKLLLLGGERLSYRTLDVEQIGSVYETMMGFRLETATGRAVAIKAQKKQGPPTAVDLEALLGEPKEKRERWLQDRTDRKFADGVKQDIKAAATLEDLYAALLPVIDLNATPDLVASGAMVLQPSEERRRSGSHYTPRTLTEPIVRTTLEPILARLRGADRRAPRPAQILDLKVCDPAMGSGAFLVEVCRQLGDALVEAWHAHAEVPAIPPDENEVFFARRLIVQRCLYGVDRNPVAVDLAKVSLWLVTLAKDHPLTFVDHALRHGDSLVGLSRKQIEAFHWEADAPRFQAGFETMQVRNHVERVAKLRQQIREASERVPDGELRDLWDEAQLELDKVRLFGDLVLAAFFEGEKPKEREHKRSEYASAVVSGKAEHYGKWLEERRHAEPPLAPFHWEIEFPEVFDRANPGFDGIVGNPPFLGGLKLETAFGREWRTFVVSSIAGNVRGVRGTADLCAYFLLRSAQLTREGVGCIGTLATNTVSEGDTSEVGLQRLLQSGLLIYAAERSFIWPGTANVYAAKVWLTKQSIEPPFLLDGELVPGINAQLRPSRISTKFPKRLAANSGLSFVGSIVLGDGFILSSKERNELVASEPRSTEVLYPYLNGTDLNTRADMGSSRWVLNFRDWPLSRKSAPPDYTGPVAAAFPLSLARIEERVRPERESKKPTNAWNKKVREFWWHFGQYRWALEHACSGLDHVIVVARTSRTLAFARLENRFLFSDAVYVFASDRWELLSVLQSDAHLLWALRFSSTLKGDLRYTNSGAFETFPLPASWTPNPELESAGRAYQLHRSRVQQEAGQGLTTIYNRFHDPDELDADILKLRKLHAEMDRAILDAYGWSDIPTNCEFLLDDEIDEEEWGDRKKPWRYRWPDELRDEVLARLLALNDQRAEEERLAGEATAGRPKKAAGRSPKKKRSDTPGGALFDSESISRPEIVNE